MKKAVLGLLVIALSISVPLKADEGALNKLGKLLNGYQSFSADFEQISQNSGAVQRQQSSGKVSLKPPLSFRWETLAPYPQLIVGNARYLWIYDPDLEQATRRASDQSEGGIPALVLTGKMEAVSNCCEVVLTDGLEQGSQFFQLTPKDPNNNLQQMVLAFQGGLITELKIVDKLGQQTLVIFSDQKINQSLPSSLFAFQPPEGTDVILEKSPND